MTNEERKQLVKLMDDSRKCSAKILDGLDFEAMVYPVNKSKQVKAFY